MFKLSTKGRYGLRSLLDLALYIDKSPIPLSVVAKRQNISLGYLEQVFSTLKKADLVKSVKGAHGGYSLSKSPSDISIAQVLEALEGDIVIIEDSAGENEQEISAVKKCLQINVWDKLNNSVVKLTKSLTLNDLIEDYKKNDNEKFLLEWNV